MKQIPSNFKPLIILLFAIGIYSCKMGEDNSTVLLQVDLSSPVSEPLSSKFNIDKIISLDSSALLNSDKINNITTIGNQLFVSSYEDPNIYIFNNTNGKLEHKINRMGRGAKEYSDAPRIAMYSKNTILVEDFAGAVNSYNLQGSYKNCTKGVITSNKLFSLININDSTFLVAKDLLGLYFYKDNSKPYYSVDLVNNKGEIVKGIVERDASLPKLPVISPKSQFYKYGNDIYLCSRTENIIYKYNSKDSTFISKYLIEVKDANVNAAFDEQRRTTAAVFFQRTYMMGISAIGNRYIIVEANRKKGENNYILIEKLNNSATVYDRNTNDIINLGKLVPNDNGQITQIVDYFDLINTNGSLKDSPLVDKIKQTVEVYENMNPVIVVYSER